MGKVVKLESGSRKRAAGTGTGRSSRARPASLEDRARARRRRIHRRGLRDRGAARARPAVGQSHRERLRRLRRDQRGRAGRRADRQRGHAGADDAGRQRGDADAVPRHQPRHAAAPELPRVPRDGRQAAAARARAAARAGPQHRLVQHGRPGDRARRHPALGPLLGLRARGVRPHRALRPGPDRRLPPARPRALPGGDRPRHVRAARARRRGLGRRPDLAAPCAPRRRCRWSSSRWRSRIAS